MVIITVNDKKRGTRMKNKPTTYGGVIRKYFKSPGVAKQFANDLERTGRYSARLSSVALAHHRPNKVEYMLKSEFKGTVYDDTTLEPEPIAEYKKRS